MSMEDVAVDIDSYERIGTLEKAIKEMNKEIEELKYRSGQATMDNAKYDQAAALANNHDMQLNNLMGDDLIEVARDHSGLLRVRRKWEQLFDLYDIGNTTLKVRGFGSEGYIAGVLTNVEAGTATLDTAITITTNTYLYVKLNRDTVTATFEKKTTSGQPSGTDTYEVYPLWWIPFVGGIINVKGIMDIRYMIRWIQ
jgi:hypothetical protein